MAQATSSEGGGAVGLTRGGPLDALRFLAAFCIVIYHFAEDAPVPLANIHPVFARGYLATDFFLIVSGYVLSRIYGARVAQGGIGTLEFFKRRAGRVVPAHLIMASAFVAMVCGCGLLGIRPLHPEFFDWRELPAQVTLLQAWGVPGGKGWNAPSWSLSALLACYAAFPVIWTCLLRIRSAWTSLAVTITVFLVSDALCRRLTGFTVVQTPMHLGVVRALPLFVLGMGLGRWSEQVAIPRRVAIVLGLGALASLVAVQALGRHDYASIASISLMVVAAGAIRPRKPSHMLEKAALVSFALFITNEFVRTAAFGALHLLSRHVALGGSVQWGLWFGSLAAAIGFAVGFHYLVDMPTQAWIKGRARRAPVRSTARLSGGFAQA